MTPQDELRLTRDELKKMIKKVFPELHSETTLTVATFFVDAKIEKLKDHGYKSPEEVKLYQDTIHALNEQIDAFIKAGLQPPEVSGELREILRPYVHRLALLASRVTDIERIEEQELDILCNKLQLIQAHGLVLDENQELPKVTHEEAPPNDPWWVMYKELEKKTQQDMLAAGFKRVERQPPVKEMKLSNCCGARVKRYVKSRNRGSGLICSKCGKPCEIQPTDKDKEGR